MRRLIIGFLLVASMASSQEKQDSLRAAIAKEIADNASLSAANKVVQPFEATVDRSAIIGFLATLRIGQQMQNNEINSKAFQSALALMEQGVDTEVGSTPDSKGSTSLAMKGAVPKVLGFAVQHGALTQEVNGNTVTFRVIPSGLIKAVRGQDIKSILGFQIDDNGDLKKPGCGWCEKSLGP